MFIGWLMLIEGYIHCSPVYVYSSFQCTVSPHEWFSCCCLERSRRCVETTTSLFRISDNAHVLFARVYVEGGVGGRGGCFYVSEGTLLLNDVILRGHLSIQGNYICRLWWHCQYHNWDTTAWVSSVERQLTPALFLAVHRSMFVQLCVRCVRCVVKPMHLPLSTCSMLSCGFKSKAVRFIWKTGGEPV